MFKRKEYIESETPLKKDLLKLFKKKDSLVILDVGGCEGEESIRYSRLFPNSSIFIFEPLPKNLQLIEENFVEYKITNAKVLPYAVSDIDGIAAFFVSSGQPENYKKNKDWDFGNKSSSLLEPDKTNINNWLQFNEKISVKTITLHTFLTQHKINIIDFIHMDVQGAELKALLGAKNYLKKIKSIWLEVADVELYKKQVLRKEIEDFMKKNNFYLVKSEVKGKAGDQLYVNKQYFNKFTVFSKQFFLKKRDDDKNN